MIFRYIQADTNPNVRQTMYGDFIGTGHSYRMLHGDFSYEKKKSNILSDDKTVWVIQKWISSKKVPVSWLALIAAVVIIVLIFGKNSRIFFGGGGSFGGGGAGRGF